MGLTPFFFVPESLVDAGEGGKEKNGENNDEMRRREKGTHLHRNGINATAAELRPRP